MKNSYNITVDNNDLKVSIFNEKVDVLFINNIQKKVSIDNSRWIMFTDGETFGDFFYLVGLNDKETEYIYADDIITIRYESIDNILKEKDYIKKDLKLLMHIKEKVENVIEKLNVINIKFA